MYGQDLIKCPICKKKFLPAPMLVYRVGDPERRVCSYSCMRAYQKKEENSAAALRRAERIRKELEGAR